MLDIFSCQTNFERSKFATALQVKGSNLLCHSSFWEQPTSRGTTLAVSSHFAVTSSNPQQPAQALSTVGARQRNPQGVASAAACKGAYPFVKASAAGHPKQGHADEAESLAGQHA